MVFWGQFPGYQGYINGLSRYICLTSVFMAKNDALLIMDTNDEDVDLGLALSSTSYHIRSRMNSSSGAGVNANLIGDMAFAASDPLSELVWLPHKGLSLKCADSSLADKNPFLLWNVESSNKVPSPSQIIRSWGPEDGRVISVGRSTVPQTFLNVDSKVDDKVTSASPLRSSPIPLLNANCGRCEGIELVSSIFPHYRVYFILMLSKCHFVDLPSTSFSFSFFLFSLFGLKYSQKIY